jgi:peptide/nickel transport system permease protein
LTRYLLTRLLHAGITMGVVVTATFLLVHLAPGGPAILLDPALDPADTERVRSRLGLDRPLIEQYWRWLADVVRLDFGSSFTFDRPVIGLILERLPATMLLGGASLLFALVIAFPLGIISAKYRASWIDQLSSMVTLAGISIPNFWLGIVLILIFSVYLGVLPSSGMSTPGRPVSAVDVAQHLVMPALVLGLATMASIAKYTRSSVLGVLKQDYVRTARAKGLKERLVLTRHALKNALIPVVTVIGLWLPRMVGGAVVTETIFSWPGMGRLAISAAFQRDYPIILGVTLVVSTVVVFTNLLVDLVYGYLDPRIRLD